MAETVAAPARIENARAIIHELSGAAKIDATLHDALQANRIPYALEREGEESAGLYHLLSRVREPVAALRVK